MKESAAKKLGLVSRRFNGKLYPTQEQEATLLEWAAAVRQVQNAIIGRIEACQARKYRYEKTGSPESETGRSTTKLFICECPGTVARAGKTEQCDGTEKGCILGRFPSESEISQWVNELRANDKRLRTFSTFVARRAATAIYEGYLAAFRRLKKGEDPGFPAPRKATGRIWIPFIHLKKTGEIGSAGSGCKLVNIGSPESETARPSRSQRSLNRSNRFWQLELQGMEQPIKTRLSGMLDRGPMFGDFARGRFLDVDIEKRSNIWHISVCAHAHIERHAGTGHVEIRFDLIDGFAQVNGVTETPLDLIRALDIEQEIDQLKAQRDADFPLPKPGQARPIEQREALVELRNKISELHRYAAAIRRNALHVWTSRIVQRYGKIEIISPKSIKQSTETARGNVQAWGAEVASVAVANRTILNYSPAAAIAMLRYKAEEAGIRCEIVEDIAPKTAITGHLVTAAKTNRRVRRQIRKQIRRMENA